MTRHARSLEKKRRRQSKVAEIFVTLLHPFVPHTLIFIGAADYYENNVFSNRWPDCRMLSFDADYRIIEDAKLFLPSVKHVAVVGDGTADKVPFYERRRPKMSSIHRHGPFVPSLIDATTLPKIFDDYSVIKDKIDRRGCVALWLDCEGGELDILKGAGSVLTYCQWINMEVVWEGDRESWPKYDEVTKWINDNHYSCMNMHGLFGRCQNQMFQRHRVDGTEA